MIAADRARYLERLHAYINEEDDLYATHSTFLKSLGPELTVALSTFSDSLRDDDPIVRMRAAIGLGAIGPAAATAVRDLAAALRDVEPRVREIAAATLGVIGPLAAAAAPDLAAALQDVDPDVRGNAAVALGKIGPKAASAASALAAALTDTDANIRRSAAFALNLIGPAVASAASELTAALKDTDAYVRLNAAAALSKTGPKAASAVPDLAALLKDTDAFVRGNAAVALGLIGPEAASAVPDLAAALRDVQAAVRGSAAVALGEIGRKAAAAVPDLITALKHGTDTGVRTNAAWALGEIGPLAAAAVPSLIKVLRDKQEADSVHEFAVWALGKIGPAAAAAAAQLVIVLQHDNRNVAVRAAKALDEIKADVSGKVLPLFAELRDEEVGDLAPASNYIDFTKKHDHIHVRNRRDMLEWLRLPPPPESQPKKPIRPEGTRAEYLDRLLATVPTDVPYEEQAEEGAKVSHAFRQRLAERLGPELNKRLRGTDEIAGIPHNTLDEKKELARWVNDQLEPLGLAVQCPNTGLPAKLRGTKGNWPGVGTFCYQIYRDGKPEKTAYADELPELTLIDATPPKEPEVTWQKAVGPKATRSGRKRS